MSWNPKLLARLLLAIGLFVGAILLFGAVFVIDVASEVSWSPARPFQVQSGEGLLLQVAQEQVYDAEHIAGNVFLATPRGVRKLTHDLQLSSPACTGLPAPATEMIPIEGKGAILFAENSQNLYFFSSRTELCSGLELRYQGQNISLTVNELSLWRGGCCLLATNRGLFLAQQPSKSILVVDRLGGEAPYTFARSSGDRVIGEARCDDGPNRSCIHVFSEIARIRQGYGESTFRHTYAQTSFVFDKHLTDAAFHEGEFLVIPTGDKGHGPLYLTDSANGRMVEYQVGRGGTIFFVDSDSWGTWLGTEDGVYLLFGGTQHLVLDHAKGDTEVFYGVGVAGETLWIYSDKRAYSKSVLDIEQHLLNQQSPAWRWSPPLEPLMPKTSSEIPELEGGLDLTGFLNHMNPGPMFYSEGIGGVYFFVEGGTISMKANPVLSIKEDAVFKPYYLLGTNANLRPTMPGFAYIISNDHHEFREKVGKSDYSSIQSLGPQEPYEIAVKLEPNLLGIWHLSVRDMLGNYRATEEWVRLSYHPAFKWLQLSFFILGGILTLFSLGALLWPWVARKSGI